MHSYGDRSALNRFFIRAFSEESIVFSVPFSIHLTKIVINIFCKGMVLQNDSMKIHRFDNKIILDGLPIADANHPRLPYDYFGEILRKIDYSDNSQKVLTKIFQLNIEIREKIIHESHLLNNEVSKILIKVMNYENDLIRSHN